MILVLHGKLQRFGAVAALACCVAHSGCEKTDLGQVDIGRNPPFAFNFVLTPDSINIDTLTPGNGNYTVSATVLASVSDPDGPDDIRTVEAGVYRPSAESPFLQKGLHDDGVVPDLIGGDGIYSGIIQFELTRALAGTYRVELSARDRSGLRSVAQSLSFFLTRRNSLPVLSNLSAPDTVTLPAGGSVAAHMTVVASDSDGLGDIREVYFLSPDGENPTFHFPLKDDGGLEPGPPSGDLNAGDGEFSILLTISDSPTVRGTYRFIFHAEDTFGDTSATILHFFTIE
jgi:hypothetical protein